MPANATRRNTVRRRGALQHDAILRGRVLPGALGGATRRTCDQLDGSPRFGHPQSARLRAPRSRRHLHRGRDGWRWVRSGNEEHVRLRALNVLAEQGQLGAMRHVALAVSRSRPVHCSAPVPRVPRRDDPRRRKHPRAHVIAYRGDRPAERTVSVTYEPRRAARSRSRFVRRTPRRRLRPARIRDDGVRARAGVLRRCRSVASTMTVGACLARRSTVAGRPGRRRRGRSGGAPRDEKHGRRCGHDAHLPRPLVEPEPRSIRRHPPSLPPRAHLRGALGPRYSPVLAFSSPTSEPCPLPPSPSASPPPPTSLR